MDYDERKSLLCACRARQRDGKKHLTEQDYPSNAILRGSTSDELCIIALFEGFSFKRITCTVPHLRLIYVHIKLYTLVALLRPCVSTHKGSAAAERAKFQSHINKERRARAPARHPLCACFKNRRANFSARTLLPVSPAEI